jgi:hypothetical protein
MKKVDNKQRLFEVMSKVDKSFKDNLNEISTFKPETYFETLSAALEAAVQMAESRGFTVDNDELFNQFGTGGVGYGETKRGSIAIYKDGKEQRKALQIIIYRMESGKYELTTYIN